jgi:hypothetical protein
MINILEKQRLGFVATVGKDGTPSLSPKGTFVALSPKTIAFGDIRSPGTRRNIAINPRVAINFVDPIARRGFRAKGDAEIIDLGTEAFDTLFPHFTRWGALSRRIKKIVQSHILEATLMETPAYDDGATEAELRAIWSDILLRDP